MIRSFHVALAFLTTLPLPPLGAWRAEDARKSVRAYPLVGLLLGGLLCLAWWLLAPFSEALRGALLLGVWLLLTGALHLDGLCDTADAAFASKSPEERQRVAQDPHVGVFALAAGGVLLLVKATSLETLQPALLLLVPTLSRTFVVLPMALAQVHASSRLGRESRPSSSDARLSLLLGGGLCTGAALFMGTLGTLLAVAVPALIGVLGLAWWLSRRMGGLGGDAYGALIETGEALMLTLAVAL